MSHRKITVTGETPRPAPSLAELIESWAEADRGRTARMEARYQIVYRKGRMDAAEIVAEAACALPAGTIERDVLEALVARIEL